MRFLRGIVVALVAASTLAHADLPPAKPPPPDIDYDVFRMFVAASAAERRGDLDAADEALWNLSSHVIKHPNVYFNHGRVLIKLGLNTMAVSELEQYLELLPNAPDAAQVKKMIADLKANHGTTMVGANNLNEDIVDATILIDGEVVGKSPVEVKSDGRSHRIARIGAASVASSQRPLDGNSVEIHADRDQQNRGNVWIDIANRGFGEFDLDGQVGRAGRLINLKPGHYSTTLGTDLCKAIDFDVQGGKAITFVYVEDKEGGTRDRTCHVPTKVRVHQLIHQPYVKWKDR